MRRPDDGMLEPEIAETLAAIDATLAGEAVDPRFADAAELSLMLAADRPRAEPEFQRSLDERVAARFARQTQLPAATKASRAPRAPGRIGRRLRWGSTGGFAAAAGALAAGVVVVALISGGSGQESRPLGFSPAQPAAGAGSTTNRAPDATALPATPGPAAAPSASPSSGQKLMQDSTTQRSLQQPPNGRKIIQTATLLLGVPPSRVDDVAQEVLNVIGSVNGIVDRSTVTSTGGPDGNAQFELRVPSSSLAQTMSALSRLRYASVVSRTDNTQDVNTRFVDANRQLADSSTLRQALLKQLASATTQQQIDSLKAQLSAAEANIASAQATLRSLNRQVDFSRITLSIQAGSVTGAPKSGGGFGLSRATHDALRVLVVAAGVALIALAVLIPTGLLGALAWWVISTVRQRRREQALDLA